VKAGAFESRATLFKKPKDLNVTHHTRFGAQTKRERNLYPILMLRNKNQAFSMTRHL
jgi:hypothetical protein